VITEKDNAGLLALIRSRLADYTVDVGAERAKLVEAWRQHHPEAAAEPPSAKPRPLMLTSTRGPSEPPETPDETWANDVYSVTLRRKPDHVFGTRQGMIQLGINTLDGTARHDWRDFQNIKNELAGEECEAFELYPAESRLMDPSNYYSLWCFPGLKRIKVGSEEERRVYDAHEALAPQRGFVP
jgi:hypothetical protein